MRSKLQVTQNTNEYTDWIINAVVQFNNLKPFSLPVQFWKRSVNNESDCNYKMFKVHLWRMSPFRCRPVSSGICTWTPGIVPLRTRWSACHWSTGSAWGNHRLPPWNTGNRTWNSPSFQSWLCLPPSAIYVPTLRKLAPVFCSARTREPGKRTNKGARVNEREEKKRKLYQIRQKTRTGEKNNLFLEQSPDEKKKVLTQNWMKVIPWLMVPLKFRSVTCTIKSSLRTPSLFALSCSTRVLTYVSRSSSCRAPSYLWILTPSMIQSSVGYPLIPYLLQASLYWSQSRREMDTLFSFWNLAASLIHVGSNLWQWPHQGAKNLTKCRPVDRNESKLSSFSSKSPFSGTMSSFSRSMTISGSASPSPSSASGSSFSNTLSTVSLSSSLTVLRDCGSMSTSKSFLSNSISDFKSLGPSYSVPCCHRHCIFWSWGSHGSLPGCTGHSPGYNRRVQSQFETMSCRLSQLLRMISRSVLTLRNVYTWKFMVLIAVN